MCERRVPASRALALQNSPILNMDLAFFESVEEGEIVRGKNHGGSFNVQLVEKRYDVFGRFGVEVTGGFVGND